MINQDKDKKVGFLKIENRLAEKLARINMSEYEIRGFWHILRKTRGWNKEEDFISISQFEDATGISRGNIHPALQRLAEKKVIIISTRGHINKYKVNTNLNDWICKKKKGVIRKQNIIPSNNSVTPAKNRLLSKPIAKQLSAGINTKETRKTIKQNTNTNGSAIVQKPKPAPTYQSTPIQQLVAHYKKLYKAKFHQEPTISNSSWGKWGKLLKNKIEQGHSLEKIIHLLGVFAHSKDSHPQKGLGFDLSIFLSDFVFNKMLALKGSQRISSVELEEKYGKWK